MTRPQFTKMIKALSGAIDHVKPDWKYHLLVYLDEKNWGNSRDVKAVVDFGALSLAISFPHNLSRKDALNAGCFHVAHLMAPKSIGKRIVLRQRILDYANALLKRKEEKDEKED